MAEAFGYWLKLGFVSFGGPAGQIAMMHQELVEKRRWISEARYLHALNYCMLLPGPEATQLATYLGWLMHGVIGGIVAGMLFFLPSLLILIALAWAYLAYGALPLAAAVLWGVKPAVVAIVLYAAWRIGSRALKHPLLWGFALAAFVAIYFLGVGFPWIVGAAGLAGALLGRFRPALFTGTGRPAPAGNTFGPALIDDHTPTPAHARFSWRRLSATALAFVLIWSAALLLLDGSLRDMALFFTRAAFLTFGGAYAVLPYVYQGGVEHYGWLTGPQMMDGLALGETTPGPLIMVVAFVGYLGGVAKAILASGFWSGVAGAVTATFFTFLPSFMFILLGGPLIEASRGDLKFTAPLAGITAAVVGVIFNLAVFFAGHTFWPRGLAGGIDWPAAGLAAVAFVALWRFRLDILWVVGAAALIGLMRGLV